MFKIFQIFSKNSKKFSKNLQKNSKKFQKYSKNFVRKLLKMDYLGIFLKS